MGPLMGDEEAEAVASAVRDGHLIGAGRIGAQTEQELAALLGVPRALLVNSCTAALEAAILLAGVRPGEDVVLPSFTFVSCANAVVRAGGRPVFADIDPLTLNVTADTIAAALTPRTRAVIVVHYAGRACDMDRIGDLAAARGVSPSCRYGRCGDSPGEGDQPVGVFSRRGQQVRVGGGWRQSGDQ
jgi:dTDP-4-amino-4,6-dideoxygalactose transaminase